MDCDVAAAWAELDAMVVAASCAPPVGPDLVSMMLARVLHPPEAEGSGKLEVRSADVTMHAGATGGFVLAGAVVFGHSMAAGIEDGFGAAFLPVSALGLGLVQLVENEVALGRSGSTVTARSRRR